MKLTSITWSYKFNPIAKGWIILYRSPQKWNMRDERKKEQRRKARNLSLSIFVSTFFFLGIHHNANLCTSPEGVAANDLLKSYLNANLWCCVRNNEMNEVGFEVWLEFLWSFQREILKTFITTQVFSQEC